MRRVILAAKPSHEIPVRVAGEAEPAFTLKVSSFTSNERLHFLALRDEVAQSSGSTAIEARELQQAMLLGKITGWDGVQDSDGADLQFSGDVLEQVIASDPFLAAGIVRSLEDFYYTTPILGGDAEGKKPQAASPEKSEVNGVAE